MNYKDYYQTALTKSREEIIKAIEQYGDSPDWTDFTKREILEEVATSDHNSGETDEYSIMAGIANY